MKIELILLLGTAFFMYNSYHGDFITKNIFRNTKYLKMIMYGFIGLSLYAFVKKHPSQSSNLLYHANEMIKYLPIDRSAGDVFEPIFNLTKDINITSNVLDKMNIYDESIPQMSQNSYNTEQDNTSFGLHNVTPQFKRMMNSGKNETTNRSVSQMKKKFVASRQKWRCAGCGHMLDHTYEVDHIHELQYGGTNHVDNLEALCRNCHGKKTVASSL
jgi:hypothetical protein